MKSNYGIVSLLFAGAALSACARELPVAPQAPEVRAIIIINNRPFYVFNVQLRPVVYADGSSLAWGHIQIVLIRPSDGSGDWTLQYTGKIFNPAGETFDMASIYEFQEVDPRPLPFFDLFSGARLSCSEINLGGSQSISPDLVTSILTDPTIFQVVFGTTQLHGTDGGAISGRMGAQPHLVAPPDGDKGLNPGGFGGFPPGPSCVQ